MNRFIQTSGVIFLVEHQKEFIQEIDQAFRVSQISNLLKIAQNGLEAIQYLKGTGIYADRITYPIPSIILVDISNPDGSGIAMVQWVREQEDIFSMPIILLEDEKGFQKMPQVADHGPNIFVRNKKNLPDLLRLIQTLRWAEQDLFSPEEAIPYN